MYKTFFFFKITQLVGVVFEASTSVFTRKRFDFYLGRKEKVLALRLQGKAMKSDASRPKRLLKP